MALLAVEGFDDGLAATRYPTYPGAVSTTYGYNGTKGVLLGDLHSDVFSLGVDGFTSDSTVTAGVRIQIKDHGSLVSGYYNLLGFSSIANSWSSYYEVVLMVNPTTGAWAVKDRTGTTVGTAGEVALDAWYYVELQVTKGNSPSGSWELRVDGASTLSATSRDTYYQATTYFTVGGTATSDVDSLWADDFYFLDSTGSSNNDFLGICAVETDLPSGNGNSSVLVGSDGNSTDNYLLVDNNASTPPATTEYVESDTEGDKDTYAMSDLTTTGTVHGVQTTLYAQKDDSGAKFVRPVIRSGSTDYPGASVALINGVYTPHDEVFDQDPDTSAAWTYTGVNAIEVGPEVRDS